MPTIAWPQLIVLMCFGDGADDSVRGELHIRQVDPEGAIEEYTHRVWRRGRLQRRETLDGRVLLIDGEQLRWVRFDGDEEFTALPRERHHFAPIGGLDVGGERPSLSRWEGTDFTRPTGPVTATTFLGRAAWQVELAPPGHKPYPLQLVVDAATGLVLRQANAGFGTFAEWTSLDIGADLPDELFVWTGPAKPARDPDAEMRQWVGELEARGISLPALSATPELHPHEISDDGSVRASFSLRAGGMLGRRPVSSAPWPEADESHPPHRYRWSDGPWEFWIGSEQPLSDAELASVRERLGRST